MGNISVIFGSEVVFYIISVEIKVVTTHTEHLKSTVSNHSMLIRTYQSSYKTLNQNF